MSCNSFIPCPHYTLAAHSLMGKALIYIKPLIQGKGIITTGLDPSQKVAFDVIASWIQKTSTGKWRGMDMAGGTQPGWGHQGGTSRCGGVKLSLAPPSVCTWASYLTFLVPSFLIHKMAIGIAPFPKAVVKIQIMDRTVSSLVSDKRKASINIFWMKSNKRQKVK